MLLNLPDYQVFEQIYESSSSQVYRGIREQDNLPVIFKIFTTDSPSAQTIGQYKLEYEITKRLISNFVINVYGFIQHQNKLIILLEDIGGKSLANFLSTNKFDLIERLNLAIQISEGVGQIHEANIIHKDINPSNIVFNPETRSLKVIDFGIASDLQKETRILGQVDLLEGTLAYISPEQTGRMNRSLDYRTDLYSMGVTFYQMLTGRLPFESNNPLELIHHHLALEPIAPHLINPQIPLILSQIILKLLAKSAEERYQSASGVKTDMEQCLKQLQNHGQIKAFELAQFDITDRFLIPEKLYGRDEEVKSLLSAFSRIGDAESTKGDRVEMVLVSGYSGIGKSRLVQEIQKPIAKSRGYFISGKCEQYQRDIPYFAIIQAFQSLIKQLLIESAEDLSEWRSQLIVALGTNSHLITQMIPSLEMIIGKTSEVSAIANASTSISASESQNRFNRVFQSFIHVFTKLEHPLVIFLDDLQWTDRASLKLLEILATSTDNQSLLLIGAYRNNEVNATHPIMQMIGSIKQAHGKINQLYLSELNLSNINQLIVNTLHCSTLDSLSLAEIVQHKTRGNPFFVNEFLKSLYDQKLLRFQQRSRLWQWSIVQIQEQNITDNVVELMSAKIQKLDVHTQRLLQISACIGNQFDFDTLILVSELSPQETIHALKEAIAEGLILSLSNAYQAIHYGIELTNARPAIAYKFVHDRIQQAAYSLIPEAVKSSWHYRIGKLFLDKSEFLEDEIFTIVNQYKLAIDLIQSQPERIYLASLNFHAANKARQSHAYESAVQYCQTGLYLLANDSWIEEPFITNDLHFELITSACLLGEFEVVDRLIDVVNLHINSITELVKFIQVQIQSLIARNRLAEAIAIALNVLHQLGVELTQKPDIEIIPTALNKIGLMVSSIENVAELPTMSDPQKLAAMQILSNIASAVYIGAPAMYSLVILKQIELSLEFGNTVETAYAFSSYGLILCASGEIDLGNQAADIALALMEKLQAINFQAKIFNLVYHFVRPWQSHIRKAIAPLLEGYHAGLESGDLEFAAYCAFDHCQVTYFAGENLLQVKQYMQTYGEAIAQLKQTTALNFHQIGQQATLNWLGESTNPQMLVGEIYNETERLPLHIAAGDTYSIASVYIQKLILAYHFGELPEIVAIAKLAEKSISGATGAVQFGVYYFYKALALLADSQAIAPDIEKLEHWQTHAPANFAHRCTLVRAEMARVSGQILEAMDLYDLAIAGAKNNGYTQEEALANELAAKFYLAQNRIKIAKVYMREAKYCYQQWGSLAKVEQLEEKYPELLLNSLTNFLSSKNFNKSSLKSLSTHSSSNNLKEIDLAAVIKAYQAIAGEIQLDQLLTTLMKILVENAGAETGYLLLPNNLNSQVTWRIEAIKTVDYENVIMQSISIDEISTDNNFYVPISLINYVIRTRENVILSDAAQLGDFQNEPWIIEYQSKSMLCMPLLNQGTLTAIVLLENNLISNAFTPERIEVLNLLSSQAAISIVKARLLKQQEDLNQSLQAEINDRQLAEKERDRLIAIIQASTDIIGMSSPEGKILWNNVQASRVRGLLPDADVSSLDIPTYHPAWALEIIQNQAIPAAIANGVWLGETALLTHEGLEIPVSQMIIAHKSDDGELEYISTIMRDISEAKEREAALMRSEKTLQNLVAGTAAVTGEDFFPALAKHIAEALHVKYALVTELVGDQLHAIAFWGHGALRPPINFYIAQTPCELALKNGEFICESLVQEMFPEYADLVTMQADGYMGIALKNTNGDAIGNLCILDTQPLQDIPRARNILKVFAARASAELQRKAANEELYQLNQSLELRVKQRTSQLEATNKELESFSYSVSHDLRAPLRAINGFSRILQENYRDRLDAEGDRYLKIVRDNAKRMGELIDDLLNLSRINRKEITRRSVIVNDLIKQILRDLEITIGDRQIEFVIAELTNCKADMSLLTQVWINLISNAIKYTNKTEKARIEIGCQIINSKNTYFIRDNGAGFDMQYADKLFGVFQRMHLESDFEGTGIGLAIVQRIIQRHGGQIWAEAAVNQGATFFFTIPD